MNFKQNRMDFEKALLECEEICEALEVLIKPEILDRFVSMISEYRNHYSSNIDELTDEIEALNDVCDSKEAYISELLDEISGHDRQFEDRENEVADYKKMVESMKQESLDSDKI